MGKVWDRHLAENTFEDILKMVGTTGWKNITLILLIYYSSFVMSFDAFSYVFLGKTPEYHCQNEFLQNANWTRQQQLEISTPRKSSGKFSSCEMYDLPYDILYTMPYAKARSHIEVTPTNKTVIFCEKREFEGDLITTVTQWDLVCNRRVLYSTTQSAVQIGKLIGSLIFGYMSDKYGRKSTFNFCVFGFIISSFLVALSSGVWTFIILRVVVATLGMGVLLSSFVLKLEMILTHQRQYIACLSAIPWGLGIFYLAGVAYYERTWYYLQILLSIPSLGQLFAVWILPESPRWLIVNEKYEKAYTILEDFAKSNKKIFPERKKIFKIMRNIHNEHLLTSGISHTFPEDTSENFIWKKVKRQLRASFILITDRRFTLTTIAMFYCWFSVSLVYYGVSLGSPSPGTAQNDYAYAALGGCMEFIMAFLPWIFLAYFGRKKTLMAFFLGCSISILIAMVLIILKKNIEYIEFQWFLFVMGRLGIIGAFIVVYLYTAELYPTNYRTVALGQSSTVARLGSIFSSYINDLLGEVVFWAPSAIFGVASALSAVAIISLPETSDKGLPDFASRKKKKHGVDSFAMEPVNSYKTISL